MVRLHDEFLGIARDQLGSLIFELLGMGALGAGADDDLLRLLHVDMFQWCKLNRLPRPVGKTFSKETCGRKSTLMYPELSSSYKAASVKTVVLWMSKCLFLCSLPLVCKGYWLGEGEHSASLNAVQIFQTNRQSSKDLPLKHA